MDQGVISTFKSYYLRNAFHKVIAAIDSDSSEASRQSKLKYSKMDLPFQMPLRIWGFMGRGQNININSIWKKLIPTLMDDFAGFKTLVEEVIADVVERARELELEGQPEDVIEQLQFYDKTSMGEELLLMHEQRKWFLEIESTPREDIVKIVEMTTTDLEYYIN